MKKLVIGLDQSYTDTGICIAVDEEPKWASHISFKGLDLKSDKRRRLLEALKCLIDKYQYKYTVEVVIEAVRLFSGSTPHISTAYIYSTCAMIGGIVDLCAERSIPIYWVETRSWKKKVLGSSKPSGRRMKGVKDPKKVDSVRHAILLGFKDKVAYTVERGPNKGQVRYNDNVADAICIAIAGFDKKISKKIEKF